MPRFSPILCDILQSQENILWRIKNMKLAEALIERADLQKKISQICVRMKKNAKTQEGEKPAEDIVDLTLTFENAASKLETLIKNINRTNNATPFKEGTLADAIAGRDALRMRTKTYRELYEAALAKQDRYARLEIKYVRCVDTAKLQEKIDALSKQFRQLDTAIQSTNWTTELLS